MQALKSTLAFDRSTKNKHLYKVVLDEDDFLGSVYIEKSALPTEPPAQITVTIEDDS